MKAFENNSILGKYTENVAAISRSIDARQEELRAAYERIAELTSVLNECRDYLEKRAEVDCDYGIVPNPEMKLLVEIDEALS